MPNFFVVLGSYFKKVFEIVWPFVARFLKEEGEEILTIVKEAMAHVKADPNFATMTTGQRIDMAIDYVKEKFPALITDYLETKIVSAIQVQMAFDQDSGIDSGELKTALVANLADADPVITYTLPG